MIKAVPLELKEAAAFIDQHHRHHDPAIRDKYRIGAEEDGKLIGVIQVGRPVSRVLCDGKTLEVLRCCSTGQRNVCSFLYSRAARVAKELGYSRIITYILETEDGASLKASGWHVAKESCGGGSWDCPSRKRGSGTQLSLFNSREKKYPTGMKTRWEKILTEEEGGRHE